MPIVPAANATPPFVVALDVGTFSVRALLFDRCGNAVEGVEGRRPCPMRSTPEGGGEVDAEELLDRVCQALDDLFLQAGELAAGIKGVALSTFWHGLLGVGPDDRPITPVYTWAVPRCEAAHTLGELLDEDAVHARTGCRFYPSYVPAKLLRIYQLNPELFYSASRWLSFGDYLCLRLFGRAVTSISMASGSGLFDVHACEWDRELLHTLSVRPDQFPYVADLDAPLQGLQSPHAERWPALKDVPWTPPLGDGACNSIGSGCLTPERLALMISSSGAMRVTQNAERFPIPPELFGYRIDRRRYVLGGGLSDGGNLVDWIRATFRVLPPEDLEEELAEMEPDGHGLTLMPFLGGGRAPGWMGDAQALLMGLRLTTRPIEVLRAGLEAIACRFSVLYQGLRPSVPQVKEIVASGRAVLCSPSWLQILADALGEPVAACAEQEATGRGAALLLLESIGELKSLEDAPPVLSQTFAPDPERHQRYQAAIDRQRRYYNLLASE